jgi:hypothetical protein
VSEPNENTQDVAVPGREFFVQADDVSIREIRMSDDVLYVMQVYAGIGNFIRGNLRVAETGQPPSLPQFLRDLANMTEAAEAAAAGAQMANVQAANDEAPPAPEAA